MIDAFIAPEVQDPSVGITPASDVYSLGVLFWEIFTQEIPEARSDMFGQSINDDDRMFPLDMQHVMKLCWKKDYKERPTINELITKLRCVRI